jgi:CRISPR-associated exonuclease Cas4
MAEKFEPHLKPTELVYLLLCPRKFWLFRHGIRPEKDNNNVKIGKTIHQYSHPKKKHELPLLNWGVLDSATLKNGEILEIKKSSRRPDLDRLQVCAYLWFLQSHNIDVKTGVISYPEERKKDKVTLTEADKLKIDKLDKLGLSIGAEPHPPAPAKIKACELCAYHEYCY